MHVEVRGHGLPLLLVHGFPLDHSMWRFQLEGLVDLASMIAPDLPGFGRSSDGPDTLTMSEAADRLAGLLDHLDVDGPITFCGLSMGGYIAWEFWRRHRERVGRLILCDTRAAADSAEAAATRRETADRVIQQGTESLATAMRDKLFAATTMEDHPDRVAVTCEIMRRAEPHAVAAALRGMAERADARPWLSEIDVPVLLLCGADDVITPPAEMRELAAALPHGQYVEIANAGHMAPLECPEAVNKAMRRFLIDTAE